MSHTVATCDADRNSEVAQRGFLAAEAAATLRHSDKALTREHYLACPPKDKPADKISDDVAYGFALIGAFVAGVGVVLVLALVAKNDRLQKQLDQRPATPAVVVVERTVRHD